MLAIAGIAALIGRAVAGYSLSGCLVNYVLACFGAIGGWVAQMQLGLADNLLTLPWPQPSPPISVLGASIGAMLLAFIGGLLGRPVARPRRTRYRR